MKILWFTWKDKKHPLSGGAEVINEALAERLVLCGHEVVMVVGGFGGAEKEEYIHGYKIIRLGNRYSVYWKAYQYYKKNLVGWADVVIDEVNTMPFFCKFYVKEKNILFIHQLCRKIWFYQMFFPLSLIGYLLEPLYLRLFKDKKVITVSESSKQDLLRVGFDSQNIQIISEGIELEPLSSFTTLSKYDQPTILVLGSVRPMKKTLDTMKAFELVKRRIPMIQLLVAGDMQSSYGKKVREYIESSPFSNSIHILGKVSPQKKLELLQKSHLVSVTSVKEGWCLVVTEANSQGTPAVVYNVDGLRDSVKNGVTGWICEKNRPKELSENFFQVFSSPEKYQTIQKSAYEWSLQITFEKSFDDFLDVITRFKSF